MYLLEREKIVYFSMLEAPKLYLKKIKTKNGRKSYEAQYKLDECQESKGCFGRQSI